MCVCVCGCVPPGDSMAMALVQRRTPDAHNFLFPRRHPISGLEIMELRDDPRNSLNTIYLCIYLYVRIYIYIYIHTVYIDIFVYICGQNFEINQRFVALRGHSDDPVTRRSVAVGAGELLV